MKMTELAAEYRESAELLKERIGLLRNCLQENDLCEMEKLHLRIRIGTLSCIRREVIEAAVVMEHYYDRGYKRNARYSI